MTNETRFVGDESERAIRALRDADFRPSRSGSCTGATLSDPDREVQMMIEALVARGFDPDRATDVMHDFRVLESYVVRGERRVDVVWVRLFWAGPAA